MRTALIAVGVWAFAVTCSAASPFDGKWTATFLRPAPAGNQDVTINVSTDQGGKVTGSMTLQGVTGEVPIEWGYVKDDVITFRVKVPGQNGATTLFVYLGKLTGDQIEFGRRPDDLSVGVLVKGTGTRAK